MKDEHIKDPNLRSEIMDAIQKGRVSMRPRWHFILYSAFGIVGSLVVLLMLLYVVSLAVFFLRDSGAYFAPSFGMRGWVELLRGLPWILILLIIVFLVLLEVLVRRYRFVYRKSVLFSAVAMLVIVVCGGLLIARTPLHRQLFINARHGNLPPPLGMLYGPGIRPPRGEVYHGAIMATTSTGFILSDIDGDGTTTVIITPRTRLPYGEDFAPGDVVVVIGDATATDTVRAYGVGEMGE